VVQTNASIVEQATAAATSMAHQATGLAQAVAQFRVEGDEAAVPALEARPAQASAATPPARLAPERREPLLAAGTDEWKEF
jgi:methyl-accepting chemotaxis protein-3 (ribose and galactose sensor receptor)